MHLDSSAEHQNHQQQSSRQDPRAFIMTLSLVLFTLTCAAMITMQLAVKYGWQLF